METNIISCVLVFAVSLCVSAGVSGVPSVQASPGIDEDTLEQVWTNCKLDLMHIKDFSKYSDIFLSDDMLNLKASSLTKTSLEKAIAVLPPQMQNTLLDCLDKGRFPSRVSGEDENPKNWYIEYFESLLGWKTVSRRQLGDQSLQNIAPAPASLAEAPAAFSVQSPASTPALSPNDQPPVEAPAQPSSSPDPYDSMMAPTDGEFSSASPEVATFLPSEKHTSSLSAVVIAVVVTAAFTFLFTGLLFYCYHKCCRNNNGIGDCRKDDRPLLTLSMSDFSISSSHKSMVRTDSTQLAINKENFETFSYSNRSQNGWGSQIQSSPTPWLNDHAVSIEVSPISSQPDKSKSSLSGTDIPSSGAFSTVSRSSFEPSATSKPAPPLPPPPPMIPSSGKNSPQPPGPPPLPPIPTRPKPGSQPPPPLSSKGAFPPPRPPPPGLVLPKPPPLGLNNKGNAGLRLSSGAKVEAEAPKAKLKPFFWDKVLANPDHSMVWHQISTGSFQFNEEMIESLFGYSSTDTKKNESKKVSPEDPSQFHHILEAKKAQNLSILLRALNVTTEEVCDALIEGNELPIELLQTMLKMSPTVDEELKLRLYAGPLSQLRPAERFLKALVDIPFAFKRMDILLFMGSLQEEVSTMKESFVTLEVACKELRGSRLFLKLLEAVLKTGNRMNDGTFRGGAQAFKLDTLLKLADVKGTDGKTTLLHFVVQEIIRSEGIRAARVTRASVSISSFNSDDLLEDSPRETVDHFRSLGLQVVASLSTELENVKKAAALDADALAISVSGLGHGLVKAKEFLNSEMKSLEEESGFHSILSCFVENAENEITWLLGEEKRIGSLVKGTTDYFHGSADKDEGLRLFVIVRDFLGMLDRVCKEVKETPKKMLQTPRSRDPVGPPLPNRRNLFFPAIRDRRVDSDEDDESPSP